MMRECQTIVVERDTEWRGAYATEPCEAAWASEAIFFIRALSAVGTPDQALSARVQISPDGMRWCDEGTEVPLPSGEAVTFGRVRHFGGWLRLAGELPDGIAMRVIVYLVLKS